MHLADPPYEAVAHKHQQRLDQKKKKAGGKGLEKRPLSFAPITEELRSQVAVEQVRTGKSWIANFCQIEAVSAWIEALRAAGATYVRTLVWIKPDITPQWSGDRPGTGYECLVLAHVPHKGRMVWNRGGGAGVYTYVTRNGDRTYLHPSEKPIALMNALVDDFSQPGALVCDPFAGSGTTGASCLRLGRRFLGVEQDPAWAAVARERLEAEARGMSIQTARTGQRSLFDVLPAEPAVVTVDVPLLDESALP